MQSVVKRQDRSPQTAVVEIAMSDIRNKKSFSSLSDELAQNLLDFIKTYCEIVYETFGGKKRDAQRVFISNHNKFKAA